MPRYRGRIRLVILDLAGTVCDGPQDLRRLYPADDGKAVKSPVVAFDRIFTKHGMAVDWATIRKPMGLFKKEHMRKLLEDPVVATQFRQAHGHDWTEPDLDAMFTEFRPVVKEIATSPELVRPIAGVKEAMDELRAAGVLLGCDTGYPVEAATGVYRTLAEQYGIAFDVTADSERVKGRPGPFLVYDCMDKANVYPAEAVVKADDVAAGIHEGRNAGAWTAALYATGDNDYDRLAAAEPDYLVPGVRYLPSLIFNEIEPRLRRGELPGGAVSR